MCARPRGSAVVAALLPAVAALAALATVCPAAAQDAPDFGRSLGEYRLTYYYIVFEKDFPGRPEVPLYTTRGKPIGVVTEDFARKVTMEGTGVLRDGRVVNLHEECRFAQFGWCFLEVDRKKAPFGMGSAEPLHPFRTLAVKDRNLRKGMVVYVSAFDGMPLPTDQGGFEFHDGCFVIEDTGWSMEDRHIDLFTLEEAHYKVISQWIGRKDEVEVFADSPLCPSSSDHLYDPVRWLKDLIGK